VFYHLKNVLNASALAQCQRILRNVSWVDGRETAGTQAAVAKNNLQLAVDAPELHELRAIVLQALSESAEFFSRALPLKVFPPMFNCYRGSTNAFGKHVDNAIRTDPKTAQSLRTDLSFTLFLSAPESYAGGELVMDVGSSAQAWKLPAGDLLLYPASTVHAVNAVTSGERLACFSWVQSMVRENDQRRILSGLDDNVIALREQIGECKETIELTATYHNLLRMWAQL
jgi:PKHD-type hydroxylase